MPALTVAARQVANAGKFKEALDQIDLTLLYEPTYQDARLLKAELLIARKDWVAGRAELEQYLRQRPRDADAKKLMELCTSGKVDDAIVLFALAEVFQRQNLPALAIPLLKEVELTVKARLPFLTLYQKQVETNWPGLGKRVILGQTGQFSLNLAGCGQVTSLDALKGMRLDVLNLEGCPITDLTPLQGMPLTSLNLGGCGQVRDLTPLRSMPLTWLSLSGCGDVSDLTVLQGMPLTFLSLGGCGQIRDLTPLKGMPLTTLDLYSCGQITDLTPLSGIPITSLNLWSCKEVRDLTPLKGMPLTTLHLRECPVRDLRPLTGMKLVMLNLYSCTQISDLTPLKDLPLTSLDLGVCGQVRDLSPLRGMPLTTLNLHRCPVSDLTPLQGLHLTEITLALKYITKGMDVLRQMKSLKTISDGTTKFPPTEFWKKYVASEFNK